MLPFLPLLLSNPPFLLFFLFLSPCLLSSVLFPPPSSSSAASPTLHSDDQLERAAFALSSHLNILSVLCTSLLYSLRFLPPRFHLFNLIPHSFCLPLSVCHLFSPNLLFLCLYERGPEYILISQFHISALPAAPSLAVQPWLSVRVSACEYTCRTSAPKNAYTWMPVCMCCKHVSVCAHMHSSAWVCVLDYSETALC